MTTEDIRKSTSYRAIRDALIRHLERRRDATLDRIEANGWKWDPEVSRDLDQIDHALVEVGAQDQR